MTKHASFLLAALAATALPLAVLPTAHADICGPDVNANGCLPPGAVQEGAGILGSGLGGDSALLTADEEQSGWARPAFEERRFDSYRAYFRYLPKGVKTLQYTLRLNNAGTFVMPASRVEAMYAPEMFGELPVAPVTVEAAE